MSDVLRRIVVTHLGQEMDAAKGHLTELDALVADQGERIDHLTDRMHDLLTSRPWTRERIDHLTERMHDLLTRVRDLEQAVGRLGNVL